MVLNLLAPYGGSQGSGKICHKGSFHREKYYTPSLPYELYLQGRAFEYHHCRPRTLPQAFLRSTRLRRNFHCKADISPYFQHELGHSLGT